MDKRGILYTLIAIVCMFILLLLLAIAGVTSAFELLVASLSLIGLIVLGSLMRSKPPDKPDS